MLKIKLQNQCDFELPTNLSLKKSAMNLQMKYQEQGIKCDILIDQINELVKYYRKMNEHEA